MRHRHRPAHQPAGAKMAASVGSRPGCWACVRDGRHCGSVAELLRRGRVLQSAPTIKARCPRCCCFYGQQPDIQLTKGRSNEHVGITDISRCAARHLHIQVEPALLRTALRALGCDSSCQCSTVLHRRRVSRGVRRRNGAARFCVTALQHAETLADKVLPPSFRRGFTIFRTFVVASGLPQPA